MHACIHTYIHAYIKTDRHTYIYILIHLRIIVFQCNIVQLAYDTADKTLDTVQFCIDGLPASCANNQEINY